MPEGGGVLSVSEYETCSTLPGLEVGGSLNADDEVFGELVEFDGEAEIAVRENGEFWGAVGGVVEDISFWEGSAIAGSRGGVGGAPVEGIAGVG